MQCSESTATTTVSIIMYHALHEQRSPISIAPATFEWQMRWLAEQRYHIIPLSRAVACLNGESSLPPRSVVLTFDDGFESVYTVALPVLARYGFPATVFLVSEYCAGWNDWPGQPQAVPRLRLMDWGQIGEMDRHGIDFGAHTCSHPRLDDLPPGRVTPEVLGSKATIEDRLGHAVRHFAYPYGRSNDLVKTVVRSHFAAACSTRLGLVSARSDVLALERIDAYYLQAPLLFRRLASWHFARYLDLRRSPRGLASAILRRPWT
jgi:peptidoglycan/xylan/chitin deacetylase (PgdA/CDA1 family)